MTIIEAAAVCYFNQHLRSTVPADVDAEQVLDHFIKLVIDHQRRLDEGRPTLSQTFFDVAVAKVRAANTVS